MDDVKMRYCGPNAEGDPREITVSTQEAIALEERGLWERVPIKTKQVKSDG